MTATATAPAPLRVLAVTDWFLPGYKAGGPVRSLSALTRALPGQVDFAVLTRDRDLFETAPYPGIVPDAWVRHGDVPVRYVSPAGLPLARVEAALREREYDVLYLNSLWAGLSRRALLLRRLGRIPPTPVVVAPRGELAPGALRLKSTKKLAYLAFARAAGLLRGVVWQATSPEELKSIQRWIGRDTPVFLAPNLSLPNGMADEVVRPPKSPGELRAVYLSRISESKNLVGALEMLRGASGRVTLDVYGMVEREGYGERCKRAVAALPPNVVCTFHGPVAHERVRATLSAYHLFILPTFSENFGHAIVEALRAGTPALISDRTPWRGLAAAHAGWDVPLGDTAAQHAALEQAIAMDQATWNAWSAGARAYAHRSVRTDEARAAHLRIFRHAMGLDAAELLPIG